MPALTTDRLIQLLEDYVLKTGKPVDLLLIGGLALQAYGYAERVTQDVDGELVGQLEPLVRFLADHQVPADLGENISGWSVVAMPPGYRDRASLLVNRPTLRVRLLSPLDFVIAKLRRGTDLDLDDSAFVAQHFSVSTSAIQEAAASAIAASPQDTALFIFQKTVGLFCSRLTGLAPS